MQVLPICTKSHKRKLQGCQTAQHTLLITETESAVALISSLELHIT